MRLARPGLVVLSTLLAASLASAQANQSAVPGVTGRVLDAFSMAPIVGASVEIGGTRVTTDRDGAFVLAISRGVVRLTVAAEGYLTDQVEVTVGDAPVKVEVLLLSRAQFKENVEVTAGVTPVTQAPSSTEVTPLQVRSVAGALENVFRVLQTLPGVNATADFDSRLSVRGGGPDQNLTIMDGVEIHDPYRLFGLTSAFNPETVENFELTAGGFSPKYGDRLSSILVIENRAGTRARPFAGSASLSITDGNVVLEGKLPGDMKGSWLVTGRRTYYDLVADRITGQNLPSFADVQAKGVWEVRPGQRLALFVLTSRERTDAQFTDSGQGNQFGLQDRARNDLASLSFFSTIGTHASSRTVVSWYRYGDALGASGTVRNDAVRSNAPGDSAFSKAALSFALDLGVRDVSVREDVGIGVSSAHFLEAGFETHALANSWGWNISGDRNLGEANGSSVRGGAGLPSLLDSRQRTFRAGGWLLDSIKVSPRVALTPGVRVDWSELAREATVSPRLSAEVALTAASRVRGAVGMFTQSPGYEKLLQADYFVDLSAAAAHAIKSERALHALGAFERDLGHGLVARIEGYYKAFDRLIVGRLETPAETGARGALYAFPAELDWSVPRAPQITTVPTNGATGRAYGFNLYFAHRQSSASEPFAGWASYTWGRADVDAYGRTYPFDYDRRHALSLVGSYRVKRSLDIAASLRVASGFPYTPVIGLRVAAAAITDETGQFAGYVPQVDPNGLYIWATDPGGVENLNTARLPLFARLDVRATFRPSWSHDRWQLYVEVINALKRKNAGAIETKLEYDPTSDRPRLTQSPAAALPLIPSFGLRVRF